ncbi:hypothetical protein PRZ48_007488 [Zasmidium cellare]|uniref:Suppressor of anucleate metulae protein B n=1 Tax=Zasmidium cellare TaxID=395010 RepID=A0ABR0EJG3_ZASCE|nr:hypothetical protein PRZ48_007488 [Zasmidium cellare]
MASDELCSVCDKPAPRPVLICTQCGEGVDVNGAPTATAYCEVSCRTKDIENHQKACKDANIRKQLYRAGDLLQAIFCKFREASFDQDIKQSTKSDGVLHIEESFPQGDGRLFRFPHLLVEDPEDVAALLTFSACIHSCAYMYELSQMLLQDITTTIEELQISPSTPYLVDRAFNIRLPASFDCSPGDHNVLALEATDGNTYILDLSGAQFGQPRPVIPFNEYKLRYMNQITQIHEHGYYDGVLEAAREGERNPYMCDVSLALIQHKVRKCLLESVEEWQKENVSLKGLIRGDRKTYGTGKTALLGKVFDDMRDCVKEWEDGGRKLNRKERKHLFPNLSQPRCTVEPKGKGSRAYKMWVAGSKSLKGDPYSELVEMMGKAMGSLFGEV